MEIVEVMGRRFRRCAVLFMLLVGMHGVMLSGSQASQCCSIGNHQLGHDPSGVAIELRRTGGLFPPSGVTIHNDGHLTATGGARVQDPQRQLSRSVLAGLLKLAEAEGFFVMPANIVCQTHATDVRTTSITIHTTAGSRTVALLTACKSPSFNQLYSVIVAASASSIQP
jgi:hypothetical protein